MEIETPRGPARVHLDLPPAAPRVLLVLGHGAGGRVDAPDLRAVRDATLDIGAVVARVEQPYRVAGRRAPAPAAHLDEAWTAAVTFLSGDSSYADLPLAVGGRSSGARVACRTARLLGARAVVALAFPLRPPSRPDRSREHELRGAGVPVLVVNGEQDSFGVPEADGGVTVRTLPGETHALSKDPAAVGETVVRWLGSQLPGDR
ncbi:MAG: alpha/beta hydrolase [Streptosporangiales bacterium]|nr:alpha/beta hydrolase [Streptosporangiales bacterium]